MGRLIDGKWVVQTVMTTDAKGAYARIPRSFRDTIAPDHKVFQPESNRYHLYVSYACPWAHRTLLYRQLKSLQEHISISVVSPDMLDDGWVFDDSIEGATKEPFYGFSKLREIYTKADPQISTSVTVPILWDKKTETIVNNESSEIIRIFNTAFNALTGNHNDYYPENLRTEIDELNDFVYNSINNGVYRCGFAKTQEAYDEAVSSLFQALDSLETKLEGRTYLVGEKLTEADIRLLPTLLRFDLVYVVHFKCNKKRIKDYKNLSRYLKYFYENYEAVKNTTNFFHIKRHYYYSHESINPYRIIPQGPDEIF
ncbi:MAG: glutathione S-transferase family protein [Spirochaetota bacterium]